jgi:hypothetical protein
VKQQSARIQLHLVDLARGRADRHDDIMLDPDVATNRGDPLPS